jgi:hypothetical protein
MTSEDYEEAVKFVMEFYSITRVTALELYRDEIDAALLLKMMGKGNDV